MTTRVNNTRDGVSDAWDFWLNEHPVSVPEIIQLAIEKSLGKWLDDHEDAIVEAIAKRAQP